MSRISFDLNRRQAAVGLVLTLASVTPIPVPFLAAGLSVIGAIGAELAASAISFDDKNNPERFSTLGEIQDAVWNKALDNLVDESKERFKTERPDTFKAQESEIIGFYGKCKQAALTRLQASIAAASDLFVENERARDDVLIQAVLGQYAASIPANKRKVGLANLNMYDFVDPAHKLGLDFLVAENFSRKLDERFRQKLRRLLNPEDELGRAFQLYINEVRYWYGQTQLSTLQDSIGTAAKLVLARDIRVGMGDGTSHLAVAEYDESKHQVYDFMDTALDRLRSNKAVLIRGQAMSGKSSVVKYLLTKFPFATVVMPRRGASPAGLSALHGQTAILLVDDLHELSGGSNDPRDWWHEISNVAADTYVIVTSRDAKDYKKAEREFEKFIDEVTRSNASNIVDVRSLTEEEAIEYCESTGLDENALESWFGPIGSLVLADALAKKAKSYRELERTTVAGVPGSALINVAKLFSHLFVLHVDSEVYRGACEHLYGVDLTWAWDELVEATEVAGFGTFTNEGRFQTYSPFVERSEVVPDVVIERYRPKLSDWFLARGDGEIALAIGLAAYFVYASPENAREAFERGLELGNGDAAFNLGVLLVEQGDLAGGVTAYEHAIAMGDGSAACNLGSLLKEQGHYAGAVTAWECGMELGEGAAALNLGFLLKEQGDTAGAVRVYERGIEMGNGDAAMNLGVLLKEQGDSAGAVRSYERGIELGEGRAAVNLGLLLEEQGDDAGAVSAYERGIALGEGFAAIGLGMLLKEQGDDAGAITALRQAIALGFVHPEVEVNTLLENLVNDLLKE